MSTADTVVEPAPDVLTATPQPSCPPPSLSPPPHSSNLNLITEGRVFTLYSFSPTLLPPPSSSPPAHPLHSHSIFLFYSPPPPPTPSSPSTNLGSFHWSAPGTRTPDPTLTLPITQISDIYLDCQHGVEWSSLSPPLPPPGLCFTLVSKRRDLRLCLKAESPPVRAAVLAAIKGLFEGAKKPVMSERKKKRMSAIDTLQMMLLRSPLITTMQQGQHLRRLTPHTFVPIPSFVHYIPSSGGPLGSLVWTDDSRALEASATPVVTEVISTLPLHTVSDVWGGKGFEGMTALPWEDSACVTVVGKESQVLHLVCDSEDKRRVWIDGIREVFDTVKRLGKVKETTEEARVRVEEEKRKEEEAAAESDRRVAAKGLDHVPEGSEREVVVHMDDSTLSAGITAAASNLLPPLPSIDTQGVDVQVDGGFTYEVDDVIAQAEIGTLSYSHQLPTDGEDPPLSTPSSVADALNAGQTYSYLSADDTSESSYPELTQSLRTLPQASTMHPAIIALVSGFTFTVYTLSTSAALRLHYSPDEGKLGSLLYSTPPSSPSLALAVSTLCDVFVGKQSAELRAPIASTADPSCCFTIASKAVALHLSAETEGERSLFLEGIKQLFLCQGKQVRGKKVKKEKTSVASTQPITGRMLSNIRAQQVNSPLERTAPVVPLDPDEPIHSASSFAPAPHFDIKPSINATSTATFATASRMPSLPNASQTSTLKSLPVISGGDGPRSPLHYLLAHSPLLATLRTGAVFTALFGSPPIPTLLLPLFVFYSPTSSRLGSIHWCDPDTPFTHVDGQSLPLHRFSDVIQGKVTAEMRSTAAAPLSAALCFSLVTKTRVLNLVAKTEKERKEWVEGVRGVFAFNKGEDGKEVQPRIADVTRITPLPFDTAVQLLSQGYLVLFVWEQGNETVTVLTEERLIWWEEDDEGDVWLCWNEKGVRTRVEGECMDVRAMTEVGVGKERAVFAGEELQYYPPHCCVSMLCGEGGGQAIHVIAKREEARFTFVSALRSFLLHFQAEGSSQPPLPSLPLTPTRVSSPQTLLSEGSAFISYSRTSLSPSLLTLLPTYTATPVFVHWDKSDSPSKYGQFFLSPLGQKLRTQPYTQFTEILNGKRSPELLSPRASLAPSECCLSLVGAKGALHLQAGSEVQRNGWIESIKCLYSQFSNKNIGGDGTVASTPFTSLTLCTSDSVLALKLPLLVQGVVVTSHMLAKIGGGVKGVTIPPQRIVLSYEPTASVRGRLHWMNEEDRGKAVRPLHSTTHIDLHEIVGVQVGNDDWARGKEGGEDRGMSLWTERRRLNLEFATGAERKGWVHALHAVMCTGKELSGMQHETVVIRPAGGVHTVNTPYGLGEITPCTPLPDILELTLPWGRLYGPSSPKIVRFVAVYTTQGLGYVILPLTETGWGGRRLVEVWMRSGGVGGGGGLVKVLAPVADLIVIPIMPPSMSDMIRQWFAGVRYPTPLQGREGGHRGQKSLIDVGGDGILTGAALFEEVNARYRDEVRRASLDESPPAPPVVVPVSQQAGGAGGAGGLPLLRLGHLMHVWIGVGVDVTRQTVLVFLDESNNRVFWHDVIAPKTCEEERTLSLDGVKLVKGRVGGTFPTTPTPGVDDSTCFILTSQTGVRLSLQAISGSAREEWISELTRWLASRVTTKTPLPTRTLPPPPPPQTAAPGLGDVFTSYDASGKTERVWVWYDEKSSRLGSIYWVDAEGERGKGDPERRIPLVSLCDLTIGKGGDGWGGEEGKKADAWSCFTLKTKRVTLNLEAKSAVVRDGWIHHIKTTIANAGKKVIDAPPS